ncbi:UvrD-helicase domain-containing protein [Desulfosediminicola ganghwensis]|uniref:UvrD-helicase domain-containing protein n=1 Tax=Desulfosediminicola ganghwensis TaxID=2569540 RepID=UPI0010ADA3D5|nr:UvrD-helicase domain-containing protein [Desulfosediminicola ganghwensis]
MQQIPTSLLYRITHFIRNHQIDYNEDSLKLLVGGDEWTLDFDQATDYPKVKSGFLWDTILVPTVRGDFSIPGVKKSASVVQSDEIAGIVERYYRKALDLYYPLVLEAEKDLITYWNQGYLRNSMVEGWVDRCKVAAKHLNNPILQKFTSDENRSTILQFLKSFSSIQHLKESHNQDFFRRELADYKRFFDTVENNPLTESQRAACVTNEDNNLVLAGAGSGKTSVIIAKAGYLVKAELAHPKEILILAYGKKASEETNERIGEKLPDVEGITTNTFHKLGLEIIAKATGRKPRVSKLQEDRADFFKLVNQMIADIAKKDDSYSQRVIDYFITYLVQYEDEFEHEEQGDYFKALKESEVESLKSRVQFSEKRTSKKSLKQETLKSFEEVVIADYLFVNGIEYVYEAAYKHDTATEEHSQYQPDFYLPDYDIYIEHYGIDRNHNTATFVNQEKYLGGMEWKRNLHQDNGTTCVETFSYEMKEGVLTDRLQSKLEKHGVRFTPMSFADLMGLLIEIGEEKKAHRFTKLIATFLDLFKQSGHNIDSLREIATDHQEAPRCHAFIDVFEPIYDEYEKQLLAAGEVDFSDMIRKATILVQEGKYIPQFKHVLVDEFQDISAIRAELVKAIVDKGKDTVLTCVGDDWQSIYRFSGSDVNYTGQFASHFGYTKTLPLDMTFRFNDKINEFATTFVTQNPAQLKKEVRSFREVDGSAVTLVEYYQDVDAAVLECVTDIQKRHPGKAVVMLLGRYAFAIPECFPSLKDRYPDFEFRFDTVHGSKGKEADFVIVLDVNDGKYGFPSKITDDPLLNLVLPPVEPLPHSEERRLFYVALTRSKHHSYVLYDTTNPSDFIIEIISDEEPEYNFNALRTAGAEQTLPDFGSCPQCKTGSIERRTLPDGQFFFGCSNYPLCDCTPMKCPACKRYPMLKDGQVYRCTGPQCGHTAKACPVSSCKDGILVERKGRYGLFWGCSNYGKTGCKGKGSISVE